ncbi:phage tail terminator protein [Atopococcus tabaci]|uniref:phage tail terminator protein n=1 Tax=Atopococcus tabaci TaxID=269774 RepID=UPI0024096179|nr:minor capsid protein [Atopococcus tabaci]
MIDIINGLGNELMPILGQPRFWVDKLPDVKQSPIAFALRNMPGGSPGQYYQGRQIRLANIQIMTQSEQQMTAMNLCEQAYQSVYRGDMNMDGLSIISVNNISEPQYLENNNGAWVYSCAISIEYMKGE